MQSRVPRLASDLSQVHAKSGMRLRSAWGEGIISGRTATKLICVQTNITGDEKGGCAATTRILVLVSVGSGCKMKSPLLPTSLPPKGWS